MGGEEDREVRKRLGEGKEGKEECVLEDSGHIRIPQG